MWMVVHMAKSEVAANAVQRLLVEEGLLVRVRPVFKTQNASANYYEIQVLASEAQAARDVLIEKGV